MALSEAERRAGLARLRARRAALQPVGEKVAYVRTQGQSRRHGCHWPGCPAQVPPAMWGCKRHWFMLPKHLRDRVWRAYRPGQEADQRPSEEYLAVAREVRAWIREHYPDDGEGGTA